MARIISELIYKLTANDKELTSALQAAGKRSDELAKKFNATGKALTVGLTLPVVAAGAAVLKLANDQIQAEAQLANAIKATGKEAEISVDSLKEFASGLQSVTTFGDEAQLQALALLQQLANLNEDGLKAVLPGILDFSTALGVDLQTAASLVGKTLGSSTNALARYGVEIDTNATQSEKLAQITEQLESRFGGAAETAANEGLGSLVQLKNSAGDLAEEFGKQLLPVLQNLVEDLSGIVDAFASLTDEQKQTVIGVLAVSAAIGPMLILIGKTITAVNTLKTAMIGLKAAGGGPVALAILGVAALATAISAVIAENKKLQDQKIEEKYESIAAAVGLTSDQLRLLESDINQLNFAGTTEEVLAIANGLGFAYGKTTAEILEIARASKNLSPIAKENLEIAIQEQAAKDATVESAIRYEQLQSRSAELTKQISDSNERIAASLQAQQERQEELQRLVEDRYLTAREKVLSILEGEKTELEKIEDQIIELEKTPWAQGELEEDRIAAIEVLRRRQQELIDEETEAQKQANLARLADFEETNRLAEQARLDALEEREEAREEAHRKEIDRIETEKEAAVAAAKFAYGQILSILNNAYDNELKRIDQVYDSRIAAIEGSGKSEEERIKLTEELEQQKAIEIAKVKREQAKLDQANAIVTTTIAGAVAAVQAFAQLGPIAGAIAAGVIGGLTVAQIAIIASQPLPEIPSFAYGGSFTVPPGFENDSFPVTTAYARSGETVTVETPQQAMGGRQPIIAQLYVDGRMLAESSADYYNNNIVKLEMRAR